jgi:N-acetylmuramoyl-L-alanine amidase
MEQETHGACENGYKEANLTREVVNILAPKLRKYATVDIYNQNRNAFYDCQNGTFKIEKYDYVLEIHFNASGGKGHGSECYVTTRENGITVEQAIMKNMSKFFTLRDNDSIFDGVKRTNFLVINTVKNMGISGALLETCFIDNKNDINVYQKNKDTICQAICDGIVEGFKLKKDNNSNDDKNEIKQENKVKEPDYTGTITYQAYTDKWLPEVNKCDNTANGFAGIGNEPISGFRCKPQYGDIIYEAHLKGGNWLGAVNSKDYKVNDLKSINSYAGVYGHAIDGIRIKSTKGYVKYRVHIKDGNWLEWVDSRTKTGSESYAGIYGKAIDRIQMK